MKEKQSVSVPNIHSHFEAAAKAKQIEPPVVPQSPSLTVKHIDPPDRQTKLPVQNLILVPPGMPRPRPINIAKAERIEKMAQKRVTKGLAREDFQKAAGREL